jgi:hypothetical protein
MLGGITGTAILLSLAAIAPGGVATSSPPDDVSIDVLTVDGTGCPAGTATASVSPDNEAVTVNFSAYLALAGRGATEADASKNCALSLRVNAPQGFTYAVAKSDHRGYARLEPGALGALRVSYGFEGSTRAVHVDHMFTGPLDDGWQESGQVADDALVFAPCGLRPNLVVSTDLAVIGGTSDVNNTTSMISIDSSDVDSAFHFVWKKCTAIS